jgi:hypothetical protein
MDVVVWLRSLGLGKYEAVIPRERDNRAAPSAIFFKKPKAIFRHSQGEGRFLSAAPFLWQLRSECFA